MSFLTDDTWPLHILNILEYVEHDPVANYNGLYTTLLFHCFSASEPKVYVVPEKHEVDSLYLAILRKDLFPLLLTHVESDVSPQGRVKADKQMREKYATLLPTCPLSHLWGLSFVGPTLRVYHGDVTTGTIVPPSDGHLEEAWNIDTFSPAGFAKIKAIVKDVVDSAAAL